MIKLNWRVLIGLVVLVGAIFWGVDSVRTRSYSGSELSFAVGSGPVTVTNATNESVPVRMLSTGTRPFSVSGPSDSLSGSSTREGTGSSSVQLLVLDLPPGVTELMVVARGSAVSFVADSASRLDVVVQPLIQDDARTTIIVAAIVALGALLYISRATDHHWISRFRPEKVVVPVEESAVVTPPGNPNIGRDGRLYSDS